MDVWARWRQVVARPEAKVPLDEAALLISKCANPALDVAAQLARLDQIAGRVAAPDVAGLARVVFGELGLRGDRQTYDDPENSYLDRVLDRRRGIPISLSVLAIEIGRRVGVRLEPVGMPGHFLIRDPGDPEHLIDAFDGGRRLDRSESEELLRSVTGDESRLTSEMLAPTGTHAILLRMLANLDRSFERRDDLDSLVWVSRLRASIPGAGLADRLQLATRLGGLGRFDQAASVLEASAGREDVPQPARDRLLQEALSLRARLN